MGTVPYAEGLVLQRQLVEDRRAGRVGDLLLLLQHPHVITVGVKPAEARAHILVGPTELAARGVELHETGRGGDVTYHGPGQIVGYPILDLTPDRCDVHRYVRDLEEVMVRVCAAFGIAARRVDRLTGTWVDTPRGPEKIGAIGVRISRWITSHGFAFNVNPDLHYFDLIVPCGIRDHGVTSLAALGVTAGIGDVEDSFASNFEDVFERAPALP
jgi:lipoyl(octanoyl) transferase